MEKIYTFEFTYTIDDEYDEIQFCAHTDEEAYELYENWLNENHIGCGRDYVLIDCCVINNMYDADEYGEEYGTREEYYGWEI